MPMVEVMRLICRVELLGDYYRLPATGQGIMLTGSHKLKAVTGSMSSRFCAAVGLVEPATSLPVSRWKSAWFRG